MSQLSLIVDGMLSGTGIRNASEGGYVELDELGISVSLSKEIESWLERYEDAHFHQYEDTIMNQKLDEEGIGIAVKLRFEMPRAKIAYYSSAELRELSF